MIIVRDREKVAGSVSLGQEEDQTKSGSWFLLQTNYDYWKSPPFYDDRRTPGITVMFSKLQFNQWRESHAFVT
jgi:hypothetical protein